MTDQDQSLLSPDVWEKFKRESRYFDIKAYAKARLGIEKTYLWLVNDEKFWRTDAACVARVTESGGLVEREQYEARQIEAAREQAARQTDALRRKCIQHAERREFNRQWREFEKSHPTFVDIRGLYLEFLKSTRVAIQAKAKNSKPLGGMAIQRMTWRTRAIPGSRTEENGPGRYMASCQECPVVIGVGTSEKLALVEAQARVAANRTEAQQEWRAGEVIQRAAIVRKVREDLMRQRAA